MTSPYVMMDAMNTLVNGDEGWQDHGPYETKVLPAGKAWFKRCCGEGMTIMRWRSRHKGAGKYPAGSRGAEQWWGSKTGWRCEKCSYFERHSG